MAGAKPKSSSPFHPNSSSSSSFHPNPNSSSPFPPAPYSCSSLHSSATVCPLGISRLESPGTATTRNLLEKLEMSDGQLQDQLSRWHEYAFNLGSGQLFDDYHKASSRLLQRNLPDIFYKSQSKAIFIPESDLPKVPRAVNVSLHNRDIDMEDYETRKQKLDGASADFLQIREGTGEKRNLQGDMVERDLGAALRAEFDNPGIEVVVLQGPSYRTPDTPNYQEQEKDYTILHKQLKVILAIESKRTLTPKTLQDAAKQLDKMRALVNVYFGDQLKSGEWVFMGMIHFDQSHANKVSLCSACEKFALHKASQLQSKLAQAEALLKTTRPVCTPCHEEYKLVVKDLVFNTLAQPINTKCRMTKAVYEKIVGKKAKKKGKDDVVGQGDVRSVLFWTNDQANLMLSLDQKYRFVAFVSSWSTGKTICMREMARRRATMLPGKHVYFYVMRNFGQKKTLLELELVQQFHDLANVTVTGIKTDYYSSDGLEKLEEEIKSRAASSSHFIDEFIMPQLELHSAFNAKLQQLVQRIRTQPGHPLLWMTVAGIWNGNAEDFELGHLKAVLAALHIVEGMNYPLRNSMATLRQAGLQSGTSPTTLTVAGGCKSTVRLSIPPGLIGGVEGLTFTLQDRDNQGEVEDTVRRAREAMEGRAGHKGGVPVLCCVPPGDKYYTWILTGLHLARPGKQCLIYTWTDIGGQSEATPEQVIQWIENRDMGHGDQDLVTDEVLSRGWETRELLVVSLLGTDQWKNLVMRSMAHSVAVIYKPK